MKRLILPILCLVLAFCLFTGCDDGYPEGKTLSFSDMQVTLPGDFIDLSAEGINADADFIYGRKTLIVTGAMEDKSQLQKMNLEEYTALVISGNGLKTSPQAFGKGYTFTYQKTIGEEIYTYTIATFEGNDHFWLFQFYCPDKDMTENRPEIEIILSAILPS